MMTISAASPTLGPTFTILVYPPRVPFSSARNLAVNSKSAIALRVKKAHWQILGKMREILIRSINQ